VILSSVMADSAGDDLLTRQKEFISSFFKKGAELADELLRDNERLASEVKALGHRYEERLSQIERENQNLASLYVAAYQLHAALDFRVALHTIAEILVNFVGAKGFALYIRDDGDALRALYAENAEAASLPPRAPGASVLHQAPQPAGTPDAPLVVVPLRLRDSVVGAISVWEFLNQKTALDEIDYELFNLLGAHAAPALEAGRLAAADAGPGFRYAAVAGLL
jgi:nitrate/nitrite-specific signal transduction histidine kinase